MWTFELLLTDSGALQCLYKWFNVKEQLSYFENPHFGINLKKINKHYIYVFLKREMGMKFFCLFF